MKRNLKKILVLLLCVFLVTSNVYQASEKKVYAAEIAIPVATLGWSIMLSLFATAMAYSIYDSMTDDALGEFESTYDASSGISASDHYDSLTAVGPQWYAEEENMIDLLENMYSAGAFLETPALGKMVGAYINRSEAENPVTILEEYFGTTIVNGENSYGLSLGNSKLMSYSTTADANGLFLTKEAILQLIGDLNIALNAYTSLDVPEYADATIIEEANALCGSATAYIEINNSYLNRQTYHPSVPAVPDITTSVNTNQEYIIFNCMYALNGEAIWTWCLTWAEPEGYNAAQYLRADSTYTLGGRNQGKQVPAFYFDTCSVNTFPHYSGLHTEDLIADGLDFNIYGLSGGKWVLVNDFTSAVEATYWYNSSYNTFDFRHLCYNSVPVPAMLYMENSYEFVEDFYKVYTIDGMRSDTDILSNQVGAIDVPIGITADYLLVNEDTGAITMDTLNDLIKENVITGVIDQDIDKTITGVIDTTNEDSLPIVDEMSQVAVQDAIQSVVVPAVPDGNYKNYIAPTGLASKFPFCIPYDLIMVVKLLVADPVVPRWEIPFKFESLGIDEVIVIDLAPFETVAAICRWCETIGFIIFLVLQTRKLISG